jgi:hypothetical protein
MDDSDRQTPWGIALQVGMVAGLATAAIAWTWALLYDPGNSWTPDKAAQLQEAQDHLHESRRGGEHPDAHAPAANADGQDAQARVDAARRRVDELEAQLEYARSGRSNWLHRIAAGGLGLTILCGLGYLSLGRDRSRRSG